MIKTTESEPAAGWLLRPSLSRRIALTLILSLVAIQSQAFLQIRLFSDPELRLTGVRWLSDQAADFATQILKEPIVARARKAEALSVKTGFNISWSQRLPELDPDESNTALVARLAATLRQLLPPEITRIYITASTLSYRFPMHRIRVSIDPPAVLEQLGTGPIGADQPDILAPAGVRIWLASSDGWIGVEPIGFSDGPWGANLPFAPLLAGGLIIALVSTFMARRLVAPLDRLVEAAERVGTARGPVSVETTGLHEFTAVARAFEEMQQRLLRFVDDRTQMLAAISHDLRSSLTRLRLAAEPVIAGDEKASLILELDDMQSMVESTLAFASGEARIAPNQATDVAALLISIADEQCDAGRRCSYDGPDHIVAMAHPTSLKRAFRNIVDNAVKYGSIAKVRLDVHPTSLVISVDDEGLGIAEHLQEDVFVPFRRLDRARGQDLPGAGLGLTIARDVVQSHGGIIKLINQEHGGLRVEITLPRRASTPVPALVAIP